MAPRSKLYNFLTQKQTKTKEIQSSKQVQINNNFAIEAETISSISKENFVSPEKEDLINGEMSIFHIASHVLLHKIRKVATIFVDEIAKTKNLDERGKTMKLYDENMQRIFNTYREQVIPIENLVKKLGQDFKKTRTLKKEDLNVRRSIRIRTKQRISKTD